MPRGGTTAHEPKRPERRPGGGLRWRFMAAEIGNSGPGFPVPVATVSPGD